MSEGMTFSPWKSLALLLPLSLFLCPPICPSVSLSVIFFPSQTTQILCGRRQDTAAHIVLRIKSPCWQIIALCHLYALSHGFSPAGISINEEAHRPRQKAFPSPLSHLVHMGPWDRHLYFPDETWRSCRAAARLHRK